MDRKIGVYKGGVMKAKQIERELTDVEYADVLDEIYGDVEICGQTFSSGRALRELDHTAFDCGKADYEYTQDEDNPIWECGKCSTEFDNEDEAEECCKFHPSGGK